MPTLATLLGYIFPEMTRLSTLRNAGATANIHAIYRSESDYAVLYIQWRARIPIFSERARIHDTRDTHINERVPGAYRCTRVNLEPMSPIVRAAGSRFRSLLFSHR